LFAGAVKSGGVLDIETLENGFDFGLQTIFGDHVAIGGTRDDKTFRDGEIGFGHLA
jgi:hypothetical protein